MNQTTHLIQRLALNGNRRGRIHKEKCESKSKNRTRIVLLWVATILVVSSMVMINIPSMNVYSLGINGSQDIVGANQTSTPSILQTRTFKVTFDNIVIHHRHEFLTRGEWDLNTYVNDMRIPLMIGEKVSTNQQVEFSNPAGTVNYLGGERSISVRIREDGELRIMTAGIERDSTPSEGPSPLSDIQIGKIPNEGSFEQYIDKIKGFFSRIFGGLNHDDGIRLVAVRYTAADNFGLGSHDEISQYNGVNSDSKGDYNLRFRIEEVQ